MKNQKYSQALDLIDRLRQREYLSSFPYQLSRKLAYHLLRKCNYIWKGKSWIQDDDLDNIPF